MDTASLFALLLADHFAGRQRRLLPSWKIRPHRAPALILRPPRR